MTKVLERPSQEQIMAEVKALTTEIVKIREQEGISFTAIGRRLGIKATRVSRLYKNYRERKAKPKKPTAPAEIDVSRVTVNQRQYAKNLMDGQGKTEAAVEIVGEKNASRFATETWQSRGFQDYFKQMLERNGLTENYIASVHVEMLQAKRTIVATHKGQITDTLDVADNQARMNAVKVGWELYQRVGQRQQQEELAGPGIVVISQENKEALEQLYGHSLDPYIEMKPVRLGEQGEKLHDLDPSEVAEPSTSSSAPSEGFPVEWEAEDSGTGGERRP